MSERTVARATPRLTCCAPGRTGTRRRLSVFLAVVRFSRSLVNDNSIAGSLPTEYADWPSIEYL